MRRGSLLAIVLGFSVLTVTAAALAETNEEVYADCLQNCDAHQNGCSQECVNEAYSGGLPPAPTSRGMAILSAVTNAAAGASEGLCQKNCGDTDDNCKSSCKSDFDAVNGVAP
jgi:hypothetical protein